MYHYDMPAMCISSSHSMRKTRLISLPTYKLPYELELVSLNHFGVIAGLFRQIGGHSSRFEETRGGRVPQKSKIWGDVFYGWSLRCFSFSYIFHTSEIYVDKEIYKLMKFSFSYSNFFIRTLDIC